MWSLWSFSALIFDRNHPPEKKLQNRDPAPILQLFLLIFERERRSRRWESILVSANSTLATHSKHPYLIQYRAHRYLPDTTIWKENKAIKWYKAYLQSRYSSIYIVVANFCMWQAHPLMNHGPSSLTPRYIARNPKRYVDSATTKWAMETGVGVLNHHRC